MVLCAVFKDGCTTSRIGRGVDEGWGSSGGGCDGIGGELLLGGVAYWE